MEERHPRRKPHNSPSARTRAIDTLIADIMWCIRGLREKHAELTVESVYNYQQLTPFWYTIEQIQEGIHEIERRGFQWDKYYKDIPDACIVVLP
jgi:hypothetical protein